jgi:hypothetical protein
MTTRWVFFLLPLAVMVALWWLIFQNCTPPLCWFLLSIALATILVLILGCLTGLASCICRGGKAFR